MLRPPLKISPDWLTRPATQAVFRALRDAGHEARAVGGAVRNALVGKSISDVDIATTAMPAETLRAAAAAGLKVFATGLQHGTVTVVSAHIPHEVTTLRRDVETFGRHATVAFTDDWVADASRRDFTINALYCDAAGTVFDPLDGAGDLAAGRVRFIGEASARIREDYLRILRFFRFTAEYARGLPDAAGLEACGRERAGLQQLSAERVHAELLRILTAPRAGEIVAVMHAHDFLAGLAGTAPNLTLLARCIAIESRLGLAPDPLARLAALSLSVREDASRLARRLKLSGEERGRLTTIAEPVALFTATMPAHVAEVRLYRMGEARYRARVQMDWARSGDAIDGNAWPALHGLPARWPVPVLPLTGTDVIAAGIAAGPRVGQLLADLEASWIADRFRPDRTQMLARLAKAAAKF